MRRLDKIEKHVEWVDALHDIAREETGLDDFGDSAYLEGLNVLLECYDIGCGLSPVGQIGARMKLIHVLKRRLMSEQAFKQSPEILQSEIDRPLVITGLVRTGSTALHYLMAQDPNRQALPYWLAEHPQPRPPESEWGNHPDFQVSKGNLDMMWQVAPELQAIHYMAPDWPEEGGHLMAHNFTDDYWECGTRMPRYVEWYERVNMVHSYERHKKLLKLIGANDPAKPWLLKYPVHMKHLQSFLEVYPDARVIWTHRNPAKVMSSYASLIAGFRLLNSESVDRDDIAEEQMNVWASGAERAIEVRKRKNPDQFYDLYFEDFVGDPVGSVEKIYAYFGIDWLPECESALRSWKQDNPQEKHGKHEHSLEGTEIGRETVIDRFANYINHFNIAVK